MKMDLSSFERALTSLEKALAVSKDVEFFSNLNPDQQNTLRAGVIQNFEFTYELAWKFIKRFLEKDLGSAEVDGLPFATDQAERFQSLVEPMNTEVTFLDDG